MNRQRAHAPDGWLITERGKTEDGVGFVRGAKQLPDGGYVTVYVEPFTGYYLFRQHDGKGDATCGGHGSGCKRFGEAAWRAEEGLAQMGAIRG